MQHFEHATILTAPVIIKLWKNVDDVFYVMEGNDQDKSLHLINRSTKTWIIQPIGYAFEGRTPLPKGLYTYI